LLTTADPPEPVQFSVTVAAEAQEIANAETKAAKTILN
jgi:hypothetical protein